MGVCVNASAKIASLLANLQCFLVQIPITHLALMLSLLAVICCVPAFGGASAA